MTTAYAPLPNPRLSELLKPWRERAACLYADIEPHHDPFFPDEHDQAIGEAAKAICADCPVVEPCLEYALTYRMVGIWGGTTTNERKALRQRQLARRRAR